MPSTSRPLWLPRRTGHPVATTPGPYRAVDLACPVELTDTGRTRGTAVVRIPHPPRGRPVMIGTYAPTQRSGRKTVR